ncbi:MAG: hypothetical protein JKY66_11205 [Spongiibacteraceae bacterium]|nr:hypothetical protein [Spongiibacteraceae bacterium]
MNDITPQFSVRDAGDGQIIVIIKGGVTDEAREFICNAQRVDSLIVGPGNIVDLDFLIDNKKKIQRLTVIADVDGNVVSQLTYLKSLRIEDVDCELDFKNLQELAYLDVYWNKRYEGKLKNLASIKALKIEAYKCESLSVFDKMSSLEYLMIHHSRKIESLDGISQFKRLRYLEISNCSKLVDIGELSECQKFEGLFLAKCKSLVAYDAIAKIKKLEELTLSGKFDNLSWVRGLKYLRHLRLECSLDDGDLGFLYEMEALQLALFNNKRNFSVKISDVQRYLEAKGFDQKTLRLEGIRFPGAWDYN